VACLQETLRTLSQLNDAQQQQQQLQQDGGQQSQPAVDDACAADADHGAGAAPASERELRALAQQQMAALARGWDEAQAQRAVDARALQEALLEASRERERLEKEQRAFRALARAQQRRDARAIRVLETQLQAFAGVARELERSVAVAVAAGAVQQQQQQQEQQGQEQQEQQEEERQGQEEQQREQQEQQERERERERERRAAATAVSQLVQGVESAMKEAAGTFSRTNQESRFFLNTCFAGEIHLIAFSFPRFALLPRRARVRRFVGPQRSACSCPPSTRSCARFRAGTRSAPTAPSPSSNNRFPFHRRALRLRCCSS
jgi:hypothetical protein